MKLTLSLVLCAVAATPIYAGSRSSADYTIVSDTTDLGGRRSASADYTNDGSAGLVVGISAVTSPVEILKSGYIAQLYEVSGLQLTTATAPANTVNENSTLQLSAAQTLNDATLIALASTSVTWSVQSGPVAGISAAGMATAGTVYQNTAATVRGTYAGSTGTLGLTVVNVNLDNFGAYASDGIDDAWQVQYFGQPPNANAGPLVDFDRDGQNNRFEYIAGLIPTDTGSVFRLRLEAVPGQPGQKRVIFSPRFVDRAYTVKAKPSLLGGTYNPLGSFSFSDSGQERAVTDLNATGATKFYQVEITKP